MPSKKVKSGYLGQVLDGSQLQKIVRTAARLLKPYANDFDAIAVRGHSGCLVGPSIALRLRKDLIIVRKPGVTSHTERVVEGVISDRYLILDDQIASGDTVRSIIEAIGHWHKPAKLAGIYLYGNPSMDSYSINEFNCWGINGTEEEFYPKIDRISVPIAEVHYV